MYAYLKYLYIKKLTKEDDEIKNFYMHQCFDDFDDMAKALHHWNIEIRQLEPSEINDTVAQIKAGDFYLSHAQFTGKTHQVGEIPPGRTFAFHWGEESSLLWRKKNVPLNALMLFPPSAKLDVISKGKLSHPHTISFPQELLLSRVPNSERARIEKLLDTKDILLVDMAKITSLKALYDKYFEGVHNDNTLVDSPVYQECLQEEFISAILDILSSETKDDNINPKEALVVKWEQLETYIEAHKDDPIKVSKLSQAVGINERSLYRLFNERYGVTPKSYLNKLRLNGVHHDLKHVNINEAKVNKIANRWGYWHMGQFAADYRELFNELPSETLQRQVL